MNDTDKGKAGALARVINILSRLRPEERERVLRAVAAFFDLPTPRGAEVPVVRAKNPIAYSEDLGLSPKDFMLSKQPRTDVERMACLAYYLTQYRNTPHFKTLDLSKLNTEAAQPKFANAAWTAANAVKRGYLANAPKSTKQLSAVGEQFVNALPEREAARNVMENLRIRRRVRRKIEGPSHKT